MSGFILVKPVAGAAASLSTEPPIPLQSLIDNTLPGETLSLAPGTYAGPVQIQKSITITTNGSVYLRSDSDDIEPIIAIHASHVKLSGLHIVDERRLPLSAVITIEGDHNELKQLKIQTRGSGIQLSNADFNTLQQLTIEGLLKDTMDYGSHDDRPARKGNGIDLSQSSNNELTNNVISNMFDGIYVENSDANLIHSNEVTHSRYGYHLMFSDDNMLTQNRGTHNVTGAMVMGVKRTTVSENVFIKQTESVSAQGLLLFDSYQTVVEHNQIQGNRVGIYVESASDNQINDNEVSRNFIGLQLLDAEGNTFHNNTFVANVIQAQASHSANNAVRANYWDDAQSIDLTGAGYSAIPYRVNPFFLTLTEATPPFQVFFGSPGMQFFEDLFYYPTEAWLQDDEPLMKPNVSLSNGDEDEPHEYNSGLIGGLLILSSTFIILMSGVKRK